MLYFHVFSDVAAITTKGQQTSCHYLRIFFCDLTTAELYLMYYFVWLVSKLWLCVVNAACFWRFNRTSFNDKSHMKTAIYCPGPLIAGVTIINYT